MPNFQAETFVSDPLERWWPTGTLVGLTWPEDENVADPFPYFWVHVNGGPGNSSYALFVFAYFELS